MKNDSRRTRAEEIARELIAGRLADGKEAYIIPTVRIEVGGRAVLVETSGILRELGAKMTRLNYYRIEIK